MECKHGHDNERDGFTCGSCIREDRERRDQLNRDAKDANLVALRAALAASQAECERLRRESAEAFSEFLLADSGMDMTNYLRLYRAVLAAGEK